ncbi:ricin B-like lectin R40C1 isoform X1 [Musa acuminata AAA Group]|uniref:ricin B-like lectin R40C1 isoform X1 n=1 Tax=Musa acuminata AAA Group TaxID=214697 RepID=UPI0031D88A82
MEFPFGHHGHHHHRREEEEEREEHRYPPPDHHHHRREEEEEREEHRYPPPGHHHDDGQAPPPSSFFSGGEEYGRPAYPPVQHVSHEGGPGFDQPNPCPPDPGYYGGGGGEHFHHHRPPYSSGTHHLGGHEGWAEEPSRPRQPTVRIFTKAEENYSLSIRDGKVILASNDPSDDYQHWIKDLRYSTKVKDEEGFPSFALINKVTGEALKHSIGATHPVRLVPYNPDYLDESVLWAESRDTGEGFRCIRMVNNIRLNFDAFHGDKDHGGVRDGTILVLWEWLKGDNQRRKIVPYSGDLGCREEMACAWYAQRQRQASKEKETKKRGRGTRAKLKIVNTPSPFHYANKMALEVPLTRETRGCPDLYLLIWHHRFSLRISCHRGELVIPCSSKLFMLVKLWGWHLVHPFAQCAYLFL